LAHDVGFVWSTARGLTGQTFFYILDSSDDAFFRENCWEIGLVQVTRSQGNTFRHVRPRCSGHKRFQRKVLRPGDRGLYAAKCHPGL